MRASNYLHQLIHSLSPGERTGVVKSLEGGKKGDKSLYLRLFLTIESQSRYDEAAIKLAFEGTSFGKGLGFPKSHLYDRVLEHLLQLHAGDSQTARSRRALDRIELLTERGLYEQALRQMEREFTKATSLDDSGLVLQLLRLKRRQVMRMQSEDLAGEMAGIKAEEAAWEAAFYAEQRAIRLHDDLYALTLGVRRKGGADEDPRLRSISSELDELLADAHLRFPARVAALRARSHLHHLREDFRAVHDAYSAEIQVWEAHPVQIQSDQLRFLRLIGQWLTSKALIGDHDGLLAEIKRMRTRDGLDEKGEAEVFQISYTLELYCHLNFGNPQEALPLAEFVKAGLQKYDHHIPPSAKLGFYYNLALVKWWSRQHSAALKWVHRILQFDKVGVRKDIRDFAPLLEMVLHYELGHLDLVESWFRSVKYRQRKANTPKDLEQLLMEVLHRLLSVTDRGQREGHVKEFIAGLDKLSEQPGISKLGIQELREWAKRLQGLNV
ncbi:MAG: hypothetical protein U0176_04345 [Bacteroidia bacterium]